LCVSLAVVVGDVDDHRSLSLAEAGEVSPGQEHSHFVLSGRRPVCFAGQLAPTAATTAAAPSN
jgi:hypothetical protein